MKRYLLTIIAAAVLYLPATAQEKDTAASKTASSPAVAKIDAALAAATTDSAPAASKTDAAPAASKADASPFKLSATVDMQVEKGLYDEFWSGGSTSRFSAQENANGYRLVADDFWLRVALKGSYQLKFLESVFNLRFYPYWTMRRKDPNTLGTGSDITSYWDLIEVNQAYIKVFKEYLPKDNLTFRPHFKIGRDGLLNSCSQLFGNYLDQPVGGYGDSRYNNILGPFKNRKVFANQIEVGFAFNVFDIVGGTTALMIGGNVNNDKFYGAPLPRIYQKLDSKLSAGFVRVYQDLFFWNNRIHGGIGFRNYTTIIDSGSILVPNNYLTAQWAFDVAIVKDVKFYTEMAMQKLGSESSTGIVRPINAGITIPTFGVLDTLALEVENVSNTFFNDESMRDAVNGRRPTLPLGWGIVAEKRYFNKFVIDWGLYSGNPTGDMKTTLRLTSLF